MSSWILIAVEVDVDIVQALDKGHTLKVVDEEGYTMRHTVLNTLPSGD